MSRRDVDGAVKCPEPRCEGELVSGHILVPRPQERGWFRVKRNFDCGKEPALVLALK